MGVKASGGAHQVRRGGHDRAGATRIGASAGVQIVGGEQGDSGGDNIEIRTLAFLDSIQPQYAAFLGTVAQGFLPLAGDASLYVAPGSRSTADRRRFKAST